MTYTIDDLKRWTRAFEESNEKPGDRTPAEPAPPNLITWAGDFEAVTKWIGEIQMEESLLAVEVVGPDLILEHIEGAQLAHLGDDLKLDAGHVVVVPRGTDKADRVRHLEAENAQLRGQLNLVAIEWSRIKWTGETIATGSSADDVIAWAKSNTPDKA